MCPDCAETVLAAARKCRFCGYRFDQPRPGSTLGLLRRLGLWRPPQTATFEEVLGDWGIAIGEGEQMASFRYVSLDGQRGYLLVTNQRLLFVADDRRDQDPLLEYPRARVGKVEAVRSGRQLIVHAGSERHRVRTGGGPGGRELGAALRALSSS